jgi:transcriptional regulator with XRE-family HTH domain
MQQTPKTAGERLALLIKERGYNQSSFSEAVGVSVAYINRIIRENMSISREKLPLMAQILNTTTDYILGVETGFGIPFYTDYINGQELKISLMNGLSSDKHFALLNKWQTISSLEKEDLLIFEHYKGVSGGQIVLVIQNERGTLLGKLWDNILTFENGTAPLDISDKKEYKIVGKLIKVSRSYK